ncbi:MAG: DUF4414 domain-containing protein [Chitinivibrionales bacterium]|nr:DUF4414 domain-containing protein [Chitinivibrionales bacterium]MBD3396980.1 DUF4414 domain-containing protein [Chitinivibrionales bacterium]
MKANYLTTVATAAFLTANMGFAQEHGAAAGTDEIFDEIMQSLPKDAKAQVDSAKQAGATAQSGESVQTREQAAERAMDREQALEELPQELRNQVEKAIGRMESTSKKRQVEFKERRAEKSGNK